jgi:hypothetical protein
MGEWFPIAVAILFAVIGFPILTISIHGWWERRHNRRMNRRRQDKHRLL